ncbi:MAG: hypothetical protein AAF203_10420, partial [Pseudomonadota bacterium]
MKLIYFVIIALVLLGLSSKSEAQCRSSLFNQINSDVFLHAYESQAKPEMTQGNKISSQVLLGSEQIFSQHYHSIQKAKKQVLFQTWAFDHNSLPAAYLKKAFVDLAEKRKQAGATTPVKVWMMINVTGLQNFEKEKQEMESFIVDNSLVNPYVQVTIGVYKARLLGANHVKNLIVDNDESIVTGANASHKFNKVGLFDAAWVLRGSISHSMSKDFIEIWKSRISSDRAPVQMEQKPQSGC